MDMPKAHLNFLSGTQELSTLAGGSALGASATFDGETHDCGRFVGTLPGPNPLPNAGRNSAAYFRAMASADQSGTLNIQQSPDGENWFTTDTDAIAADFTKAVYLESKVVCRYVRCQLVNGATAQTKVELDSALVSI